MNKKVSEEQEYFIFRIGSLFIAAVIFFTIVVAFLWAVRGLPYKNLAESEDKGIVLNDFSVKEDQY